MRSPASLFPGNLCELLLVSPKIITSRTRTRVAQLVEHRSPKPAVGGSSPSSRAISFHEKSFPIRPYLLG